MKLQLLPIKSTLLYDGLEDAFWQPKTFQINDQVYSFKVSELHSLYEYSKKENAVFFDEIITLCKETIKKVTIIPDMISYKGADDLSTYYKQTTSYIAIFSLGETQPARYKIYLEYFIEIIA